MSELHIASNLFLETQELNRLKKFLMDDGFRKDLRSATAKFGIIKDEATLGFESFRVIPGVTANTVIVKPGIALDSNMNLIVLEQNSPEILIPNQTNKFWIFVRYEQEYREKGILSVNVDGTVTATGAEFTKVLRNKDSGFPVKIKFSNAVTNTGIYEVLDVVDDNNIVLNVISGVLTSESDLNYIVIGSFTEGYVIPEEDQGIYRYDGCQLNGLPLDSPAPLYVVESVEGEQPDKLVSSDIFIARVWRDEDTNELIIEDKRIELWDTQCCYSFSNIPTLSSNSKRIVGVESVKWLPQYAPRDFNEVNVGWGFRSSTYTVNSNIQKITLQDGNGGCYFSSSLPPSGAFNGMRFYFKNGEYSKIVTSTKVGSTQELILESIDMSNVELGTEVVIVPDVEGIEFKWYPILDSAFSVIRDGRKEFDINTGTGKLFLYAFPIDNSEFYNGFNTYQIQYRLRNNLNYSDWFTIENSNQYYVEKAFDPITGTLSDSTQKRTVNDGQVILKKSMNSLFQGQLFGVKEFQISSSAPVVTLDPVALEDNLVISGNVTLSAPLYFVVLDGTFATLPREKFCIHYENTVNLNGEKIIFKLNGTGGTTIVEYTAEELGTGSVYFEALRINASPYWRITLFKPYNTSVLKESILKIDQNGTSDPTLTILKNLNPVTFTTNYVSVGSYGLITDVDFFDETVNVVIPNFVNIAGFTVPSLIVTSKFNKRKIAIQTWLWSGTNWVATNGILKETPINIRKD